MAQPWDNANGKPITDAEGRIVDCSACPCAYEYSECTWEIDEYSYEYSECSWDITPE